MDAGEGLPGRWGPADAARPAPRPLPARPGRGAAVGGVWPRAERAGRRLRGGRLGSDSPVFAGLALLRFARGTRVTGLAGPRPAGTGRGSAAPGAGGGARAARVPKRRPWELLPPPRSERRGKRFPFCGVLWVGWSQDTCSALPAPLVRGLTAGATPGWCFCGRAWEPQPARRPELPGSRGRAGRGRGSAGAAGSPLGSAGGRVGSASRGPGASPRAAASVGPAGPGKGAAPARSPRPPFRQLQRACCAPRLETSRRAASIPVTWAFPHSRGGWLGEPEPRLPEEPVTHAGFFV